MIWRETRKSGEIFDHAAEIWRREMALPRWFRNSSVLWTRDEVSFRSFIDECEAVYSLFSESGRLTACVYIEKPSEPGAISIHLSIVGDIEPSYFVEKACELRDTLFHSGIKSIRGWIFERNFALCRIIREIGFTPTGFIMDHGVSHRRIMRWSLVEISAA